MRLFTLLFGLVALIVLTGYLVFSQPNPDWATPENARTNALEAVESGEFHQLYIGEQAPPDYRDRVTGLPMVSVGCDMTDSLQTYVDEYNATVRELLAESPPFPVGMNISWSVTGPFGAELLTVSHDSGSFYDGEVVVPASIDPEDRYFVGMLAHQLLRSEQASAEPEGEKEYMLSVEVDDSIFSVYWGSDQAPVVPEPLFDRLEELRDSQ